MSAQDHGGGRPGPPIAGDPHSFPTDAELARTLVAAQRRATLCTLTAKGYPYGSAVSHAVDEQGAHVRVRCGAVLDAVVLLRIRSARAPPATRC